MGAPFLCSLVFLKGRDRNVSLQSKRNDLEQERPLMEGSGVFLSNLKSGNDEIHILTVYNIRTN